MYGNRPKKLEPNKKKKKLKKIIIMPGYLMMLKIANNSPSRYTINFSNLFKNWDLINQYLWGKIIKTIKQEIQFKFTLNLNIVTEGSNEENRLDILKKKIVSLLDFWSHFFIKYTNFG